MKFVFDIYFSSVNMKITAYCHVCCFEKVLFICYCKFKNGKHILTDKEVLSIFLNVKKVNILKCLLLR